MGGKRYELSEAQWAKIAPLLPGKASDSDGQDRITACS
jgi:transposase